MLKDSEPIYKVLRPPKLGSRLEDGKTVRGGLLIGANKNLACDAMEAHAKYLVCLIRLF